MTSLRHLDRSVEKAQESSSDEVIICEEERGIGGATQQWRDYG